MLSLRFFSWSTPRLRPIRGLLIACLWGSFSTFASAAGPGFVYPGADVIAESRQPDSEYALALGSITRSQGEWQPAHSQRLRGDLLRLSYQLPGGHSPGEAHNFYRQRLQAQVSRVLFDCEGRDCGGSNHWANRIFGVKELYGPDGNQRYSALELKIEGRRVIAAIYSIERANRRSYIHIDWLELPEEASPTDIAGAELLRSRQPLALVRSATGWDAVLLKDVAALLAQEKDIQLYVVGHAYRGATLEVMRETGRGYAAEVAARLVALGVAAERLSVHSVGPLAPAAQAADRVVLLRR